ncbi:hypothetical protein ACIQWR_39870 [Streptomyces sp. NPDC098789]|uniref:hypothetical protein n=1 Tax=Streptomyces sp. NPDC098789 TaxID=3366098 RepID=UPI003820C792
MRPLQAPAVTLRTDRAPQHPPVIVTQGGIHHEGGSRVRQVDPMFGVLWELWSGPGAGLPQYGVFDPAVQRRAADRLLCAHGLCKPKRSAGGMLWLLHADREEHAWPADIRTTPPICRGHAELALARCATLRRRSLEVRVPEAEPVGVFGTLFAPGTPPRCDELVLFDQADRLRYVLARYLVLELRGATPDSTLNLVPVPEGSS